MTVNLNCEKAPRKGAATKISKGEYIYRGYRIYCFGYYEPEHRVVWEAVDPETGDGVAYGFTRTRARKPMPILPALAVGVSTKEMLWMK